MVNLLPENIRRNIYRSYLLRILSLAFVFVGAALLLGTLGLLPAIIDLDSEISFQQATIQKREIPNGTAVIDPIVIASDVSRRVRILTDNDSVAIIPHEAVAIVLSHKGSVSLEGFSYSPSKGSITVRGTARDRSALLSFSNELKADPGIAGVDLPVSALLPEGARPFLVTISLKQPSSTKTK